jgi:hypothetical protein
MAGSGASATGTGIPGTGGAGGSWPGSDAGVIKEDIVSAYGTNPDQSEQEAAVRQAFDQALDTCLPPSGADLCARDTCGLVRSCCVGRGDCCQATELSGIPKEPLDLSPCDGQEPAACLAREGWPVEAFGPRQSHVHGDGFYPGGDATGDSGLRLQPLFDLQSQRVKLSAVFHRGIADCNAGCLEGVGIGFSAAQELPADATGNIALVYSKSIGEMRLVRNGMVVAQADMTGTEFSKTLSAISQTAQTPVLILSDYRDADSLEESMRAGANGHITKPILPHLLVTKVHALLCLEETRWLPNAESA